MKPLLGRWQIVGLACLLAVLVGVFTYFLSHGDSAVGSTGQPAGDFTVASAKGPLTLASLRGQVVVVYFGYTSCPDACPTTLGATAQALALLTPAELAQVQPVFISVDPERDRLPALQEYAAFFHPKMLGTTASKDEIAAIARRYGVYYHRQDSGSASGYTVDHSSSLYLIDGGGQLAAVLPHGSSPAQIAAALRHALSGPPSREKR